MKILIVDDDPDGLYLLEAMLKSYGHEVMAAENGRIALESARANPPELIISDILMPVMDGYKLCREWKKDSKLKKIPFIFYTASYTDPKDEEYAHSLGTDRFIIKPMEPQNFMKIIDEVIKVHKAGKYVEPKRPEITNETAILKGHFERMTNKLKDKMTQLEIEIAERKRSEERIVHLNAVLQVVRNVNQLITKVKDRQRLLQSACNNFIKMGGYNSAWIALIEEGDIGFITAAQAGVGPGFPAMVDGLKRGELTRCMRQAVGQSDVLVLADPAVECGDCPLVEIYAGKARLIARLEHEGRIYGFITVTVSAGLAVDEEERWLFEEVADDIALALHNMELEEKHKRADEALLESEEKYRLLAENTLDCIWKMDKDLKFTYINQSIFSMLGFTPEEWVGSTLAEHCSKEEMQRIMGMIAENMKKESYITLLEMFLIHKDGREVPAEIRSNLIINNNKNLVGLQGTTCDITERKQAERELQERMNELETFYRATLGREERVIELKQEVNELLEQLGKNKRYGDYS